ncbi:hypothetical protein CLORY_37890 [Clostridium oryzae]|uniref:Uncharacterized protein n=1 Tax=Clostridium oryzae TaxID=1450648 RepID=A0A1V4IET6_9CLOT|nr:hypothetical protein CLORY_37890 [Clostridium oryzae]
MSIYVIIEYVAQCKLHNIQPTFEGLYQYKEIWKE